MPLDIKDLPQFVMDGNVIIPDNEHAVALITWMNTKTKCQNAVQVRVPISPDGVIAQGFVSRLALVVKNSFLDLNKEMK